ncbi:SAM-dependent methyltransferase [Streptomyces sp. NRRL S-241]|uniref:SAM-dependent methyltransferase n=1 Tax=Streptomyces sp. NRRL S-241 TaxID=1463896 RepID=UPI0004C286EA|nr:SAM-dependent methyltransferase [Streptomyces sp. NRRL S-241]
MSSAFPDDYFSKPTVARVQDHLDGGTDNYRPDRDFARALITAAPWLPGSVRVNRAHGPRILNCLTRVYGIDQVVDLGCGLPHADNRYLPNEVRRMVYVDSDPGAEAHARMVLAERHGTASLRADLENMPTLVASEPIAQLDRGRPVGVLLHDVLPWVGVQAVHTALAALRSWLPAGSVLSITHATTDMAPKAMGALTRLYEEAGIGFWPRSGQQIRDLLSSWAPLETGEFVTTASWGRRTALHPRFDHSHAYAILASPGDRTS